MTVKAATCRVVLILGLGCVALVHPHVTTAGPILLPPGGLTSQVDFFEPIGQSFTAEDPFVEAGLYFRAISPSSPNTDPIQYDLYDGVGTGGTLLSSLTFSLPTGFVGFQIADFSSIALMIGDPYTLVASVVGTSPHWGLAGASVSYSGGTGIESGSAVSFDYALSVNPVPEPATLALMGLGLAGIGFARGRRLRA